MFKGTVKGAFGILGEETRRQFPALQVVADTFTADPFPGTGLVGAAAFFQVGFFFAFHILSLKGISIKTGKL